MGKEISLIAFLDEVVSRNTQHYRKDFELDAQKLRDALNSPYMDERIFYFMSRPNGTWCILERDAFLRDSDGYKIWTHYADMPDDIEAYRVTITGRRCTAPMGHVVKLNYREQTLLEKRNAICMTCGRVSPISTRLTFEELAVLFEGSTASGAERAYRKAVEHLTCLRSCQDFFAL